MDGTRPQPGDRGDCESCIYVYQSRYFLTPPLLLLADALLADAKHSDVELRLHALGKTDEGCLLHVTFTLREAGKNIWFMTTPSSK